MSDLPGATAICVAGMHRSGTSLLARLLQGLGVYLGPEEQLAEGAFDNPDGYWENTRFVALNDAVLSLYGGAWDLPPRFPADWVDSVITKPYRERAAQLAHQLSATPIVAWKDPRNSLTLPLWRSILPDLKVVICVRNPLEVAMSLRERNLRSPVAALRLWLDYYTSVLRSTEPGPGRVVTEFSSLLAAPSAELRRVAGALSIAYTDEQIERVTASVRTGQRHHVFVWSDLVEMEVDRDILECYRDLAIEAGITGAEEWAIPDDLPRNPALVRFEAFEARLVSIREGARPRLDRHTTAYPSEHARVRRLRLENDQITSALRYYEHRIDGLRKALAHMEAQRDWHAQDRDHVTAALSSAGGRIATLEDELRTARARVAELERAVVELESTKAVKLQRRYWRAIAKWRGER